MQTFEYQTALTQQGRVTHVDGDWIGSQTPTESGAIDTCPGLHEHLAAVGAEGWELCGTIPISGGQATNLVFKRPR